MPLLRGLLLVLLVLACFGLSPAVRAVVPAPDGAYPGFNTAEGQNALFSLTTGLYNTAIGGQALKSDTTGASNTAVGVNALVFTTTGSKNTAVGQGALGTNTTSSGNVAVGFQALGSNTIAASNVAVGLQALTKNSTGSANTANGSQALYHNTTGGNNTANGYQALYNNTTGYRNTANGTVALYHNTTGGNNTANGFEALFSNTTGSLNVANGFEALATNTTGFYNNAIGFDALFNNTTGSDNTAMGHSAGGSLTTGSGNVCIGAGVTGVAGESNTTRVRNIYTTVQPVVGIDPDYVTINSTGRLGRANVSSRRYKYDIKPMDKASEAIFALQPVTFRYKQEFDPTQTLACGLIAEEVAKLNPDLVGRNPEGQPESVRYEQINVMLLNEFLREHRTVQELKSVVAKQEVTAERQEKEIKALTASLKEQAAQIQKVSARLGVSKAAPRVVANQ